MSDQQEIAFAYYLESESSKRYIGCTLNLQIRLNEHNAGKNKATRPYRPWRIIGFVKCADLSSGRKLETKFKKMKSRKRVEAFIRENGSWLHT